MNLSMNALRNRMDYQVCRLAALIVLPVLCGNLATAQQTNLLYDNGTFVNRPGQGPGGADLSLILPGWGTWGIPATEYYGARVADDFIIPAGDSWNISGARFFIYHYGTINSLFTRMSLQIWDGSPLNPQSKVIWGNTTANVMADTGFTGAYHQAADYPSAVAGIMRLDANVNVTLPPGTYWFDWSASLSTYQFGDPYQSPLPADRMTRTGDALSTPLPPEWAQAGDAGRPLEYPFLIFGVVPEPSITSLGLLSCCVLFLGRCLWARRLKI